MTLMITSSGRGRLYGACLEVLDISVIPEQYYWVVPPSLFNRQLRLKVSRVRLDRKYREKKNQKVYSGQILPECASPGGMCKV